MTHNLSSTATAIRAELQAWGKTLKEDIQECILVRTKSGAEWLVSPYAIKDDDVLLHGTTPYHFSRNPAYVDNSGEGHVRCTYIYVAFEEIESIHFNDDPME